MKFDELCPGDIISGDGHIFTCVSIRHLRTNRIGITWYSAHNGLEGEYEYLCNVNYESLRLWPMK